MEPVQINRRFIFFWRGQNGLNYEYNGIKQKTTIVENKEQISFFPPRLDAFAFTSILPSPTIFLPLNQISESSIKSEDKREPANNEYSDKMRPLHDKLLITIY